MGLTFGRFFEEIVERCVEARFVWGAEFYFDATKVEVNASLESSTPRFAMEQHLQDLFEEDEDAQEPGHDADGAARGADRYLDHLPHSPKTPNRRVPKGDACLL